MVCQTVTQSIHITFRKLKCDSFSLIFSNCYFSWRLNICTEQYLCVFISPCLFYSDSVNLYRSWETCLYTLGCQRRHGARLQLKLDPSETSKSNRSTWNWRRAINSAGSNPGAPGKGTRNDNDDDTMLQYRLVKILKSVEIRGGFI